MYVERHRPQDSFTILNKSVKSEECVFLLPRLHSCGDQDSAAQLRDTHTAQWNHGEPESDPSKHAQPVLRTGAKAIPLEAASYLSKWCWSDWTSASTNEPQLNLISKWILNKTVKRKTETFRKNGRKS